MFTKTERTILNALPKKYKCIFRDRYGNLRIGEGFDGIDNYLPISEFSHLFKVVKAGAKPIYFREPILDDIEREYLKTVFKPFASRIECVKKRQCEEMWKGTEYIEVLMTEPNGDNAQLPVFKSGAMYKGMRINKSYTLDELDITYD
ncbi:MAG: hypothetical protein MR596_03575 [Lachnospiraceae bacterium]|nr:hypothetical protein [Lachnospiraceae bacterium]